MKLYSVYINICKKKLDIYCSLLMCTFLKTVWSFGKSLESYIVILLLWINVFNNQKQSCSKDFTERLLVDVAST